MKKFNLPTLLLLCTTLVFFQSGHAQNQNWVFGVGSGVSFCTGGPTNFNNLTSTTSATGTASVSDSACGLLFYTDGVTVWDSTGLAMPNGNGTLAGNNGTSQPAIIVPNPGNPVQYYIFSNNASFSNPDGVLNGFTYSIVDMSLPGNGTALSPQGDVVSASINSVLYKSADSMPFYSNSRVAALKICGTNNYWIVTHESGDSVTTPSDTFIFYRLTASGVAYDHKQGIGFAMPGNYLGGLHFSQDGTKAVCALAGGVDGGGDFFSFDDQTGLLSDWVPLTVPVSTSNQVIGAEFSPNGNFVYLTNEGGGNGGTAVSTIFQYNVSVNNTAAINSSRVILDSVSLDTIPGYNGSPSQVVYFYAALALGPDGKIYSAEEDQNFLAVIDSPDLPGVACGLHRNGYQLGSGMRCKTGLPNELVTLNGVACQTGIQQVDASPALITIFPNPSSGLYTITDASNASMLSITDALGRMILTEDITGKPSMEVDLSKEESGIYFFRFSSEQGTIVKKVILTTGR